MRLLPVLILCALLLPAGTAAAQPSTAAALRAEIAGVTDTTARQWAGLTTPAGQFANPFPADLARGHGPFAPPMLVYALHRTGLRTGDDRLVAVAERAWPQIVAPVRASAFDMLGAAYAYRTLPLSDARREQLAGYLASYGIPINGRRCLMRSYCWSNLKLIDALAVLSITGLGIAAQDPAARLGNLSAARTAARRTVNRRVPGVVDHRLFARIGDGPIGGTVLSDPPEDPLAYHALSTFALGEAVAQLGPAATRGALRARRETLDALSLLVAPDGDASYLGRGQDQVWVPAIVAAAMTAGARDELAAHPKRAARYLAAAQRAVRRLAALHSGPSGLQLVPGATGRTTAEGIDDYAHTVAYNGLALFGLTAALDALDAMPDAPVGALAAEGRLTVRDEDATGLAIVANGRHWMAVHKKATNPGDLRQDVGLLALKRRTRAGWVDLLAPRPLTVVTPDSGGPSLLRGRTAVRPTGFTLDFAGRRVKVHAGYRRGDRVIRRAVFRWRLTARGALLRVSDVKPGDRFRLLAWTPEGTGGRRGRRGLVAARTRWRFDRPIRLRRLRGYHAAAIERLDALEARLTAPRSGEFTVRIGS